MFIAALLIILKVGTAQMSFSGLVFSHKKKCSAHTCYNMDKLNERSQVWKATCYVISVIWNRQIPDPTNS